MDAQKQKLVDTYGAKGRQILQDLTDYAAGVTAGVPESMRPWTVNDAIAVTAFIGSIFGNGGGGEVRNAEFLAKLRTQLGAQRGGGAFVDLMEADDADAPTTTKRRFPYGQSGGYPTPGSPLVDPGTTEALPTETTRLASNFLIVNPFRSATARVARRDGPAARLLLPRDRARGRPPRPRHQRPGRVRARRLPVPAARAHARTTRGASPPRATTTATSSSRSCASPTARRPRAARGTTSTGASAGR